MDGMPVITSTKKVTALASAPLPYSTRYTAVSRPSGAESTVAMPTCSRVPISAW